LARIPRAITSCILTSSAACLAAAQPQATTSARQLPAGVYARISLDAIYSTALTVTGSQAPTTELSPRRSQETSLALADAAVVNYIDDLLDNPALSGVAPEITWKLLNPGNPGSDQSKGSVQNHNNLRLGSARSRK
jgi:hypothetical protein